MDRTMRIRNTLFVSTLLAFASFSASAQNVSITGGYGKLDGSSGGPALDVPIASPNDHLDYDNEDASYTASFAWHFNDTLAMELWSAWPSERSAEVDVENGADIAVAQYKVRPVMLSVHYAFPEMASRFRPFVGLGWQWTKVSDEHAAAGQPQLQPLQIHGDDGIAAVAGIDIALNKSWFIRGDVRYLDSELNTKSGTAQVAMNTSANSMFYGASIGLRF
jgi:outer membrane protein